MYISSLHCSLRSGGTSNHIVIDQILVQELVSAYHILQPLAYPLHKIWGFCIDWRQAQAVVVTRE